ncbi:hypothetical protein HMPREF1988_00249 [Porphyromonas gingivalis F0185]|nr:hypothetical protein HMPREF1988_00249 [Porphyromonas gingivalis F0185]
MPLNDAVINNPVVFTADFSGGTRRGRRVPLHYNVMPEKTPESLSFQT